ncbi:MAG: hypothetical protein HC845_02125 [Akkermansiaceae bacterium]|nr:hypothetical protein [Akkermansiaceae bacterium]
MKTNSDTTPALYIGLGVHKEKTSIAIADPGTRGEVRHHGEVATTQIALDRIIRRIAKTRLLGLLKRLGLFDFFYFLDASKILKSLRFRVKTSQILAEH